MLFPYQPDAALSMLPLAALTAAAAPRSSPRSMHQGALGLFAGAHLIPVRARALGAQPAIEAVLAARRSVLQARVPHWLK